MIRGKPNEFGNIVNTNSSIYSGFQTVEKSIDFIKTEKEIFDKVNDTIETLEKMKANMLGVQKEIVTAVGSQPTEEAKYYLNRDPITDEDNYYYYLRYPSTDDVKECSDVPVTNLSNFNVEGEANELSDIELMRRRYNDLCRKICNIIDRIDNLNRIKIKLNSNSSRKMSLDLNDMERFGF